VPLRGAGAAISPFNAFPVLRSAQTVPLRLDWIREHTLAVARFLEGHRKVKQVDYAGLPGHLAGRFFDSPCASRR